MSGRRYESHRKIIERCLTEQCRVAVIRRDRRWLTDTWNHFLEELKQICPGEYTAVRRRISFKNGSAILFAADTDPHLIEKLRGQRIRYEDMYF